MRLILEILHSTIPLHPIVDALFESSDDESRVLLVAIEAVFHIDWQSYPESDGNFVLEQVMQWNRETDHQYRRRLHQRLRQLRYIECHRAYSLR